MGFRDYFVRVLPTDYSEYGGGITRWATDETFPDCSWGCKWWRPLYKGNYKNEHHWDMDWGVCINPGGPRRGLLTWEHQAGYGCFEEGFLRC